MPLLLLPFIIIPIAEIAVFIQAGQWVGLWPTLIGILLSAVIGSILLRRQGLRTVRRVQAALGRGDVPVREVFDGLCLFVAGALLLTPGFITDTLGFLLLIPPVRRVIGRWLWSILSRKGVAAMQVGGGKPRSRTRPDGSRSEPDIIDVEYREVDPKRSGSGPERIIETDKAGDQDAPPLDHSRWGRRGG